jgi:hypothetical protein
VMPQLEPLDTGIGLPRSGTAEPTVVMECEWEVDFLVSSWYLFTAYFAWNDLVDGINRQNYFDWI